MPSCLPLETRMTTTYISIHNHSCDGNTPVKITADDFIIDGLEFHIACEFAKNAENTIVKNIILISVGNKLKDNGIIIPTDHREMLK